MICSLRTPPPEAITPTTPLRLKVIAAIAYPDGSINASALRRLIVNGQFSGEVVVGRYYTTMLDIERMRERCRVKARDHTSNLSKYTDGRKMWVIRYDGGQRTKALAANEHDRDSANRELAAFILKPTQTGRSDPPR